MKIFSEQRWLDVITQNEGNLQQTIKNESRDYLLNVNETQYVEHLLEKFRFDPLILRFDDVSVSDGEKMVRAEQFPSDYNVYAGKSYPRQFITYHLPFSGDERLLHCRPSTYIMWTHSVRIERNEVCFDVVIFQQDAQKVKAEVDGILNKIQRQYTTLSQDVADYNRRLESQIRREMAARKAELLQQSNLLGALGVPFRKAGDVPKTFAVPGVQRKIIVKPQTTSGAFTPEPTLDGAIYGELLKVIHDVGREMERHPSIYTGKDEEGLRDVFLIMLSPQFENGSVTGETFNKGGKTDILIRHEGKNVFVAECKIWKGAGKFSEALDQLLGYLTWRDSKTAIICFVRAKELSIVLSQIEAKAPEHPCFVRAMPQPAEGQFQFEFHLKDDPSRSVQIAVLCFHYPEKSP